MIREGREREPLGLHEIALVRFGKHEEVTDEAAHAIEFIDGEVLRLLDVRRIVGVDELQVAAHDGDGGAKLVADVIEEGALSRHRRLDPVEHAVDGTGQLGEVIVATEGDAAGEVGFADGICCHAEILDRA